MEAAMVSGQKQTAGNDHSSMGALGFLLRPGSRSHGQQWGRLRARSAMNCLVITHGPALSQMGRSKVFLDNGRLAHTVAPASFYCPSGECLAQLFPWLPFPAPRWCWQQDTKVT